MCVSLGVCLCVYVHVFYMYVCVYVCVGICLVEFGCVIQCFGHRKMLS